MVWGTRSDEVGGCPGTHTYTRPELETDVGGCRFVVIIMQACAAPASQQKKRTYVV